MTDKLLLVSADAHVGGFPDQYRQYFEPEYRQKVDELIVEDKEFVSRGISQDRYSEGQLERMDERSAIRSGGLDGAFDLKRRLKELDGEGVAGELLNPGHQLSTLPFFSPINKPQPAEIRAAGARAYHRWLGDQMSDSGGRLFGTADAGPCLDMAATVREMEWVAEHGFVSVQPPGAVADPSRPPATDPYYEPFWAACADLGLVINAHIGHGFPQVDRGQLMMQPNPGLAVSLQSLPGNEEDRVAIRRAANPTGAQQATYPVRRVIWQLMISGVLDRHPKLKVVLAEVRADWVPATLAFLEAEFDRGGAPMKLRPAEYWARNFFVAPSSPRPYEVAMRHEVGLKQMLLATDYPHPEGTWPNTQNWLRAAFAGVPEAEARLILGENAVACYNLDRDALLKAAARIGPSVEDVLGGKPVSQELIVDFDRRSAYLAPQEDVDMTVLAETFRKDVQQLTAA
ncbi:MAG: putative amidohydrolase [Phenylobacterium sp.]|nr:putative amidohydrolase [Phenylobacterium sp.]